MGLRMPQVLATPRRIAQQAVTPLLPALRFQRLPPAAPAPRCRQRGLRQLRPPQWRPHRRPPRQPLSPARQRLARRPLCHPRRRPCRPLQRRRRRHRPPLPGRRCRCARRRRQPPLQLEQQTRLRNMMALLNAGITYRSCTAAGHRHVLQPTSTMPRAAASTGLGVKR